MPWLYEPPREETSKQGPRCHLRAVLFLPSLWAPTLTVVLTVQFPGVGCRFCFQTGRFSKSRATLLSAGTRPPCADPQHQGLRLPQPHLVGEGESGLRAWAARGRHGRRVSFLETGNSQAPVPGKSRARFPPWDSGFFQRCHQGSPPQLLSVLGSLHVTWP